MAVELFANLASTTVISGGSTAPASGTTETWTVSSSTGFPAASNSATPPTQFHIADISVNSEIIAVTNVSGTTWSVTRGAEGTTPVSHAFGFRVYQVITASAFSQLKSLSWLNVVTQFGADPTGVADSTTAIQNAVNALPAAGTSSNTSGGVVYFPAGKYKVTSTITISNAGVYLAGDGIWASTISYSGSGDCIRMYSPNGYGNGAYPSGGGIRDLSIDGTGASAGACGIHAGDIYQLQWHVGVRFFQGTNSKGIWFDNQYFWTEDMYGHLFVEQNTTNLIFDNSANLSGQATGSFARPHLTVVLDAKGVGDGIVLKNTAQYYGGDLMYVGNMDYSSSATKHWALTVQAPPVLSYTATNASPCVFTASGHYYGNGTSVFLTGAPTGFTNGQAYFVVNTNIGAGTFQLAATSGGTPINSSSTGSGNVETFQATTLQSCRVNINVECNATNANPQPGTINFTSSGSATGFNNISRCNGVIDFSATSVGFATAVNSLGNFYFDGPVYGDTQLWRSLGLGVTQYFNGALASSSTIITQGVTVGVVNTTTDITGMILQGGGTDSQLFTVQNNGTGRITFAASGTSRIRSGASCNIPPNTAKMFYWRPDQGSWYDLGAAPIDATASDIQPNGVRSAGTSVLVPAADHVHQNQADLSLLLAPSGATGEAYPRTECAGYTTPLTSGTVFMSAIPLPANLVVNNLGVMTGSTAPSVVTHGWLALTDSNRIVRAVTADQTSSFGSGFSALSLPVAVSYTTPTAGLYYLAVNCVASTMGTLSIGNQPLTGPNSTAPILAGSSSTGQTTPPSTGSTLATLNASGTWRFYGYTA